MPGRGYLGWHAPGHHGGRAAWAPWRELLGDAVFDLDLTELPGLDNLHDPRGIIRAAAAGAAAFFGAAETHFLVNGTSAGILAVLLARCRDGDRVLLPRNCHQSAVHGLVLSGATPVYLPVPFHPGLGLPGLLRTEDLRSCLAGLVNSAGDRPGGPLTEQPASSRRGAIKEDAAGFLPEQSGCPPGCPPGARKAGVGAGAENDSPGPSSADAVDFARRCATGLQEGEPRLLVLLHPNYYGLTGDLAGQIQLAHRCGLTVLADEAHGSHFRSSPLFPTPALAAAADFAAQGAHKTLGAFTQAAWLHCREGGEAALRVSRALRLVQTTSPSYLLLASLDAARHQLQQSAALWEETACLGLRLRQEITAIPGLLAHGEELLEAPGVVAYDPSRLVVNVSALGITGFAAAAWLRGERRLLVEMADLYNLVFILGPGDMGPPADSLLAGLQALAAACGDAGRGVKSGRRGGKNDSGGGYGGYRGSAVADSVDGYAAACGYGGYRGQGMDSAGRGAPELAAIMRDLHALPIPRQALTPRQAFLAPGARCHRLNQPERSPPRRSLPTRRAHRCCVRGRRSTPGRWIAWRPGGGPGAPVPG